MADSKNNDFHQLVKTIPLSRGLSAIVDSCLYDFLSKYKWRSLCTGKFSYAITNIGKQRMYMHRMITGAPKGMVVDHINHNPLDNRLENLRVCTYRHNMMNLQPNRGKSSYKGVSLTENNRWLAKIKHEGKRIHLGAFLREADAARAYNVAAAKYFGEYALLNVIKDENPCT